MSHKAKKPKKHSMAAKVDRHELYEQSVQNVEFEIPFINDTFKTLRGRDPRSMREDFCGTANAACAWIKHHDDNTAIGVDLDSDVLQWGREHHIAKLKPQQAARISLLEQNVLDVATDPVDVILATNFSYWCFQTRELMRDYFRKVHAALQDDGVFFLDAYGGYEAFEELEEETEYDEFTYVWDQAKYNPLNGHMTTHIHFRFPDGSELSPAFSYEWRLWTLPEILELLTEAGFQNTTVYTQGWDEETEEETDEYYPTATLDADPGWVVYLTATK